LSCLTSPDLVMYTSENIRGAHFYERIKFCLFSGREEVELTTQT